MNKSIHSHSTDIALALICLLTAACGPSLAESRGTKCLNNSDSKNSRVTASLYCVQGKVTVKGWERELIARDPSLAKFHWSPITAARPGKIYFRQPISVCRSKEKPFRTLKPQLISTARKQSAHGGNYNQAEKTNISTSTRLLSYPQTYTATYATYSCQVPLAQRPTSGRISPAQYSASSYAAGSSSKVYGRLISAK